MTDTQWDRALYFPAYVKFFDLFVQLDIALRQEVGPMTYDNPLQKSVRKLAEACGIDWREVGEHTFSIVGLQDEIVSRVIRARVRAEGDGE